MQGGEGCQATTTISGMPLLFRHLAAAALPLASTTAGIVAVGIAMHLPAGLSGHISVQAVIPPVRAAAPVVARVAPRRERTPVRPKRTPSPTRAPVVAPAPVPRVAGPVTVVATPGPPERSPRMPLPPDEAAPLTPPVPPVPTPQPTPAPEPVPKLLPTLLPAPAEPVRSRALKHAGKEPHRDQRRHEQGVVVVLSIEPPPADGEGNTIRGRGTDSERDRTPGDDDFATSSDDGSAKASDKGSAKANGGGKGDGNGDGYGDGNHTA